MAEGIEDAAQAFEKAIDPAPQPQPKPAPRDTGGRFAAVEERPEPIFQVRMVEGDPETGDTSDGGDDPRLRSREREIADGRIDERAERQAAERQDARRQPDGAGTVGDETAEVDEEDAAGAAAGDAADGDEADEGPSYEITVDGEPAVVTLNELRNGYIREATFHSRLNKVAESKQAVEWESRRVADLCNTYIQGLQFLDEDLRGLSPPEPDWDAEYAKDPLEARRKQKSFQEFAAKLNQIRANRAWAIQNAREEHDRQSARYAIEQFTQFVQEHKKYIKDEPSLQRIISGMRQEALNEGFNEQEVAGVYDKRMLNILFKSHLYTHGMAVRPQAVIPGKGKALIPGAATPIGNATRRNVDEAFRRQAKSGSIEDTANLFQRLLR